MSDFSQAVKFLDLVPARRATEQEARNSPFPSDKYYNLVRTRDIKKIFTYITFPQTLFSYASGGLHRHMGQYNVTMPKSFYLLNANKEEVSENVLDCYVTVKWRVCSTVYRYVISISNTAYAPWTDYLYGTPFYTNQLIGANCCFEIWRDAVRAPKFVGAPEFGIQEQISFKTSIISNPTSPEEIDIVLDQSSNFKDRVATGFTMPATMPISQPTMIFDDNGCMLDFMETEDGDDRVTEGFDYRITE